MEESLVARAPLPVTVYLPQLGHLAVEELVVAGDEVVDGMGSNRGQPYSEIASGPPRGSRKSATQSARRCWPLRKAESASSSPRRKSACDADI